MGRIVPVAWCAAVLAAGVARAQTETDLDAGEIDALLVRVADPNDIDARAEALARLLEAQAGSLPLVAERLFRNNGISAALLARLVDDYVRRLPGEVPEGSPVPRRTALAPLLHLLVLAPHETYRESWAAVLQAVALLAALDAIDTPEAIGEAIRFVSMYDGAFGRPVGLLVRGKGDRAVPALVRARKIQSGPVREFIGNQLARMGRDRAPLMAQVDDDQILAEILRALAEVRDSEGVNVMLSFVNSERPFVRKAARESLVLYERNAIWAVRKSYEDLTGERADPAWGWRETIDRLYAAQDAARLEPLDTLLAQGLADAGARRHAEMEEQYATILGREPEYPRRLEMIPGLLAYGEELLAQGDVLQARRVLRMAGYIAPAADARTARIRAHLAYLEGLRRRDLGFPDPEPFRDAARLDPAYARLIAERGDLAALGEELPAAESAGGSRGGAGTTPPPARLPVGRLAAAAGIVLAALAALLLLILHRRVPGRLFGPKPAPGPEGRAERSAPEVRDQCVGVGVGVGDSGARARIDHDDDHDDDHGDGPQVPGGRTEEPPDAAAPTPPPDDPYRRIELALARIRKDVEPERERERERERDHDHDHDDDHDDDHDHDRDPGGEAAEGKKGKEEGDG